MCVLVGVEKYGGVWEWILRRIWFRIFPPCLHVGVWGGSDIYRMGVLIIQFFFLSLYVWTVRD